MADQTQRLEIATVKAEIGSDILSRFSNDAVGAAPIPTDSGDIQNLKQVIVSIQEDGAEKISFATTIYPTTAAGIAATTDGAIFLVRSADPDEIYAVYSNTAGVAVDTGKRALSAAAIQTAMDAALESASAAEDSADLATLRVAPFLGTFAAAPSLRNDGSALQIGDRYFNNVDDLEYLFKSTGWEPNNLDGALLAASGGASLVGFQLSELAAFVRNSDSKMSDAVSAHDYGYIGDGTYHPLSELYATVPDAQFQYPNVAITTLVDSIDWAALQQADYSCGVRGRELNVPGHALVTKTIEHKTNWVGCGAESKWGSDGRGTIIETYGAGNAQRWTDIDGTDAADRTPLIVAARSGASLRRITLKCGATRWSDGYFVATTRRNGFYDGDIVGQWKNSGLYLDATGSTTNTTLKALHPNVEYDAGMNEFSARRSYIEGLWGLSVLGTTRSSATTPFLWSPGGTSDNNFFDVRFGTNAPDAEKVAGGGAFRHSAVIPNTAGAGQGMNFTLCAFRVNTKYGISLDYSNRITFSQCYGETIASWVSAGNPEAVFSITSNTSSVVMIGDGIGFPIVKNGTPLTNSSLIDWQESRCITKQRADGYMATPNFFGNASSSIGLLLTSFATNGTMSLRYDNGTTAVKYLNFNNSSISPAVASAVSLGTTSFPFLTGNINDVRVTTALRPTVTNSVTCGTASFVWSGGFTQVAFTVTSDERLKDFTEHVNDVILDAWERVDWKSWKFKSAVTREDSGGSPARIHFGTGAQTVDRIFREAGLEPGEFSLFCYDEWSDVFETVPAEYDEEGTEITPESVIQVRASGDQYGLRYEECLCLEAALQRRTVARQSALIEALTARMEALEAEQ